MINKKTIFLAASSLAVGSSFGVVTLQDSYAGFTGPDAGDASGPLPGGGFGYEITVSTSDFSAAGHDKLVMVFSGHDGNTAPTPLVTSVTYDGVSLTEAIQDQDNGNIVTAGIFYLDNVATDGTLRIELDSDSFVHYGFGLYALDGLKPGVQDTGTARSNAEVTAGNHEVSITTDEGFFVQEVARNNQTISEDGGDAYETLYNLSEDSYRALSQYRVTDASGTYVAPVGNTGDNFKRVVTAAFEAEVIPEPSSSLLMALAGFGLLARRRR